jgi:hypothetical protein
VDLEDLDSWSVGYCSRMRRNVGLADRDSGGSGPTYRSSVGCPLHPTILKVRRPVSNQAQKLSKFLPISQITVVNCF